MSPAALSLDEAALDDAFPWHLVFDRDARVRSAGRALRRLLPTLETEQLAEAFEAIHPTEALTVEAALASTTRCWLIRSRVRPLIVLRGQFVPSSDGRLAFIGGLRASPNVLQDLGLALGDFAAHDAIGDCLFLVQAQEASLADAVRLAAELEDLNGRLEVLVSERTRELTATKADLEQEKAERERVESELRLAHRLEAVGQLASGVAHEINTPIQYVGDSVQFIHEAYESLIKLDAPFTEAIAGLRQLGDVQTAERLARLRDDVDAEYLVQRLPKVFERTFDGLQHVAGIVRAMKAFARSGSDSTAPADINEALTNTLAVARNEYKYVADVETDFGELPPVTCKIAELNQVFLNLILNASQAVAERAAVTNRRGQLRIRTSAGAGAVHVSVTDDGSGIPDSIRERIFDPFFTTKPVGKGTGQGLTISLSIVRSHGGKLDVQSAPGEGSTFTVTLPVAGTPAEGSS